VGARVGPRIGNRRQAGSGQRTTLSCEGARALSCLHGAISIAGRSSSVIRTPPCPLFAAPVSNASTNTESAAVRGRGCPRMAAPSFARSLPSRPPYCAAQSTKPRSPTGQKAPVDASRVTSRILCKSSCGISVDLGANGTRRVAQLGGSVPLLDPPEGGAVTLVSAALSAGLADGWRLLPRGTPVMGPCRTRRCGSGRYCPWWVRPLTTGRCADDEGPAHAARELLRRPPSSGWLRAARSSSASSHPASFTLATFPSGSSAAASLPRAGSWGHWVR